VKNVYCDADDVKAFSKITYLDLGYANDSDFITFLNSLIVRAGALLDDSCNLPETFFNAGGYAVTGDMYDFKYPDTQLYVFQLYKLPPISLRYQPITTVTKVEYNTNGYGMLPNWVEIVLPGYIFDPISCTITIVTKLPAMAQLSIKVAYTAGYTTTPNTIKYTCVQICANMLHEFLQRKISPNVTPTAVAVKIVAPDSFPASLKEPLKTYVRRFVGVG